jgi:hypothetical protein
MHCPASVAESEGIPDSSSPDAEEGTRAHTLAAVMLLADIPVNAIFPEYPNDMIEHVTGYVSRVEAIVGDHGILQVEQAMSIGEITGEPGAEGTTDALVLLPMEGEIVVVDLKYGMGVRVEADGNPQLKIYGVAAAQMFGLTGEYTKVRLVIDQPRLRHVSEAVYSVTDLLEFGREVFRAAEESRRMVALLAIGSAIPDSAYQPSEDGCRWCRAKARCPALARQVQMITGADFEDLTAPETEELSADPGIGVKMQFVDLIEQWCRAVRAETERRLLAGVAVPGWKLVTGRAGPRAWADEAEATGMLKRMRLQVEEMYNMKLISPTQAEKLAKSKVLGPRQWKTLQQLITQPGGKPSVAPATDSRPALEVSPVADDFDVVTTKE